MSAESSPRIVIVDESPIRAAILEEGLREAGYTDVVADLRARSRNHRHRP
jgi:response regulator NasT